MDAQQLPTPDSEEPKARSETGSGTSAVADKQQTSSDEPISILYKVKWEDTLEASRTQDFQSEDPIGPLEVTTESFDGTTLITKTSSSEPAIEVVTSIEGKAPKTARITDDEVVTLDESDSSARSRSSDRRYRRRRSRAASQSSDIRYRIPPPPPKRPKHKYEPVAFEDIKITDVFSTKIIIHSNELLEEIRGVVKYFPEQNISGGDVEIYEPYPVLVHHLDELEALRGRLLERDDSAQTSKYLEALLLFLKRTVGPRIKIAKDRLSRPVPVVTYDDLWILFKPGTDVYCYYHTDRPDIYRVGLVVIESEEVAPTRSERRDGQKGSFKVKTWGLESNGVRVSRDEMARSIGWFEGERQVKSLPIYPSWVQDKEDGGKCRQTMEERGERLYQLIRSQPKQMWYDGYYLTKRTQKYRGNAIIDTSTAIANKDFEDDEDTNYGFFLKEITFYSDESDMIGYTLENFPFAAYHDIDVKETPELPSKHHYFLLQPIVPGFALYDKTWRLFNVESLTEVKSDSNMESLIIDPGNRDIVQAICHAQSHPWKIDSVSNKGEGQVALLHGPPGVGKTYTVECIAQATGRPLIALTIGDLIDDEEKIEAKLVNWFTLAERWKAILLLDEADIFLERRATRDIQRNGIVSIFLRRMEYFRGLLFLTTNRVGQIDDAFLSRVTVVLQYDHLTDDTRKKIWNGFFRKLQRDSDRKDSKGPELIDGRKIEIDRYAQSYVLNDPDVTNLKWNGREIRNALQTAISLASYKALKDGQTTNVVYIEMEHFVSVVEMSRKFKAYMSSITGKEEGERARARLERADPKQSAHT